jgi:hypothetical protein
MAHANGLDRIMKAHREGTRLQLALEGAIGETTGLFTYPLQNTKELVLDMAKVTYINSIGVKHWILWTLRIPTDCQVKIINTPFVIATQASIVLGFVSKNIKIDSISVPYNCESCGAEDTRMVTRGVDYEYGMPGQKPMTKIPTVPCPKCKTGTLEPDFMIDKTFKFLG